MSTEPALEQSEAKEQSVSLPFPKQGWGRILYGLFLTVMPAFSFWASSALKPDWQDGKLSSYLILLLSPKASLWFLPLLAYSVISYLLLSYAPERFSKYITIQIGIFTGFVLAAHFSILVLVYSFDSLIFFLLAIWLISLFFPRLYRWAVANWTVLNVNRALIGLVLVLILLGTIFLRGGVLFFPLIFLTMAAPFWSFLIALRTSIWLLKKYNIPLNFQSVLIVLGWGSVYVVAWRYNILKMFELYSALPKQPPDCYIATAAAQGHSRVVGSCTVNRPDGKSMRVNGQLQRLKCAELALMAVSPQVHKVLRKIYDVVGKALARRMTNPFVADVAYLLLKPFEWGAVFVLKWIVPEIESVSRRMYINQ